MILLQQPDSSWHLVAVNNNGFIPVANSTNPCLEGPVFSRNTAVDNSIRINFLTKKYQTSLGD